ncbi:nitrate- and nitrite sensing domain-containing protein [Streptomyces sp. NPDC058657]|uniref:nitrate- and nitrite sensing domain-containing protein n=1 Tax=unclassified Streptomyces TaxID=2593676 RepID=UPI003653B12E
MRRSKNGSAEQQTRGNFTPPSRTAAPPAAEASAAPARGGSSSRMAPRNWRVATRLNAILLIPVLVALVMGGFQVNGSINTWRQAQDAEKTALIVRAAGEYGHALLNERDLTAEPLLSNKRNSPVIAKAYAETDAAAKKFAEVATDLPSEGLERRLKKFREEEPKLASIRKTAFTAQVETAVKNDQKGLGPVATEEGYVLVQHSLMEFANELSLNTGNVTSYGRSVYAIQLSKAAGSLQRSIGTHLLVRPNGEADTKRAQTVAFTSYNYLERIALLEFVSGSTPEDEQLLRDVMAGKTKEGEEKLAAARAQATAAGKDVPSTPRGADGSLLTGMAEAIGSGRSPQQLARQGIVPATWMAASTAKFDGYTEVEGKLVTKAVDEAARISADARNDAIINGAVVVIALLAAFILAGMIARQMSRSMKRLRTAAFSIAEQRLPMLVDQLSRTDPGRVDTRVEPIPITSHDEIGEVARAFDQVHREAVRLAAEQAMLRGNVNAIFTNLSRRSQSLIEGQLTLITDLENNEADPDQLENLFKLDHLATRMRRNGENLLVLAGEEPGRRWNQPVPLVDVLRAASSEVENYERIELTGVPESEIHGQAVTDLVHLLAELLENATTFSSPQTKVRVAATRLPDGRVMVEIHDKGIGLTAEDFADINHKLANPPTVDAAVSQRMGLFVVGRLADRHGIRVQLRPSGEQAGTTSLVMLPDAITHGGGGEDVQGDFTVSSIMGDQQTAPEQPSFESAPMRTAAELGFDDSQYEGGQTRMPLDPVNRSRLREERRAALEGRSPQDDERPLFRDEVTGDPQAGYQEQGFQDPAYPAAQEGRPYQEQPYQEAGYPEQQYQDPASPDVSYDHNGYPTAQLPPVTDAPQTNGFDGFGPRDSFGSTERFAQEPRQGAQTPPQQSYPEPQYQDPQSTQQGFGENYGAQSQQGDWQDQNGFQGSYGNAYETETESSRSPQEPPADGSERIGFDRLEPHSPAPGAGHDLTNAGLPRRGSQSGPESMLSRHSKTSGRAEQQEQAPQAPAPRAQGSGTPQGRLPQRPAAGQGGAAQDGAAQDGAPGGAPQGREGDSDWRTSNDERWQRAEKLKDPKAGGVTPSGLPKRVPKANLVEGAAEQTPQGGPQVSRAPEDVRGRLSNLRRGVQQGRNAGTDQNQAATYDQHSGPGSTYNQER